MRYVISNILRIKIKKETAKTAVSFFSFIMVILTIVKK